MPYLKFNTNVEIEPQQSQQLLSRLSQVMVKETGKPERYVMIEIATAKTMLFGGSAEPLVYAECKSIGLTAAQAKSLSAAISQVLKVELAVAMERIYIEFSDCPPAFWGWNGGTFG